MNSHTKMSLHYICRSIILLGFAGYIVYLVEAGKLQYYIVPRMIPYVQYAMIGLYALAIYFIYLALQERGKKRHEQSCGCNHEPPKSFAKSGALYGLFLFPLLIGILLPDKIMGSDVAAIKGMNLNVSAAVMTTQTPAPATPTPKVEEDSSVVGQTNQDSSSTATIEHNDQLSEDTVSTEASESENESAASSAEEEDFDILFPSDQYSVELAELGKLIYTRDTIEVKEEGFLEVLTMLDMYRDNFIGKTIKISGFVYREDGMDENTFVVSRMAMQCCSADAMPYGFLVYVEDAHQYELDSWISVEGIMGVTMYNDIEIVQLKAKDIQRIQAPTDPYVYPFFDNLVKLADS